MSVTSLDGMGSAIACDVSDQSDQSEAGETAHTPHTLKMHHLHRETPRVDANEWLFLFRGTQPHKTKRLHQTSHTSLACFIGCTSPRAAATHMLHTQHCSTHPCPPPPPPPPS